MARALECEGFIYFCANVLYMVLCVIGSLLSWIILMGYNCYVLLMDLVRLAIGS